MKFQYIPYLWALSASALSTIFLGLYAFLRYRKAKGAGSFIISMAVLTLWTIANGLEMSAIDLPIKLFFANIQYIAYCYSPVALLSLCLEFTGFDRIIKTKKILFLVIVPTIIIILVWTDRYHGLMRYNIGLDLSGAFPVITKSYGPVFYIHAVYSHCLNIAGWVLLIKAVMLRNTVYRRQAAVLLVGLSLIVFPNILYISGLSPIQKIDITPVFFGPAGIVTAWGIFRYRLFDVIPLAWATVIKNMDAGVMVLDLHNRILDVNLAFEKIIGKKVSTASTKEVSEVCGEIPQLAVACKNRNINHAEFSIKVNGHSHTFEVLLSPITDDKGVLLGRLAVTYDITQRIEQQQEYMRIQWEKAVRMERERHARDMHDNLGQVLGYISFQAQGIKRELLTNDIHLVSDKLDKLVNAAQSAHNDIREYIRNTINNQKESYYFITTLKKNIVLFEEQTGIKVKFDVSAEASSVELSTSIKIHLLNIVKEGLNNIRKHSKAERACISLERSEGGLYLTIEDNGKGFSGRESNSELKTKFGLDIMRERVVEIGGEIFIRSEKEKGCRIVVYIPLQEVEDELESNAGG